MRIRCSRCGGDDAHVLVGGLEIDHLVDRHQVHDVADRCLDHLEPSAGAGAARRAEQARATARARAGSASASARARPGGPAGAARRRARRSRLHRLEQVVDRLCLEGLQRVLVVGGDEHEQRERLAVRPVLGQRLRRLQAAQAGHADVEEAARRALQRAPARRALSPSPTVATTSQLRPQRAPARPAAPAASSGSSSAIRARGVHGASGSGRRTVASAPPSPSGAAAASTMRARRTARPGARAPAAGRSRCRRRAEPAARPTPVSRTRSTSCVALALRAHLDAAAFDLRLQAVLDGCSRPAAAAAAPAPAASRSAVGQVDAHCQPRPHAHRHQRQVVAMRANSVGSACEPLRDALSVARRKAISGRASPARAPGRRRSARAGWPAC